MARAQPQTDDKLAGDLARQVSALASGERELRGLLEEAHTQIGARDAEIEHLRGQLRDSRAECERVTAEATAAHAQMAAMRATRLWRAGATWWWIRDLARRRAGGG